jgi:N-acetyl-anhydromuramyl-L-alanine amidase AmpD
MSSPADNTPKTPLRSGKPSRRTVRRQRQRLVVLLFVCGLFATVLLRRPLAVALAPTPMPLPYDYVPSPNCDNRPAGATINCLVLHATVEPTTEGTMGIFLNTARKVSAHFVVGRDGRVVQMVPVERRAWHAGPSVLDGTPGVNDYSVGIEMVNLNDGKDPYTDAQIHAVAGILRFLRSRYNIPDSRVVSHASIALPAGRKSDPVGFDFARVCALARTDAAVTPPPANPPNTGEIPGGGPPPKPDQSLPNP